MLAGQIKMLIADADPTVRKILKIAAGEEDWLCDEAANGIAVLKLLKHEKYNIIVIDAELPEIDGRTVCRQIRKVASIPVIFLGKSVLEEDKLAAFSAGGNDYVVKPFYPRELLARINSLLTLYGRTPEIKKVLNIGGLVIDMLSRKVTIGGREIALSPKEYDLLLYMAQNPSVAHTRDKLLSDVWGADFFGVDRTVDTHVKSVRNKIRPYHYYLVTVWGYGYKFET